MTKNILNKKLKICSINPMTGWRRNGYCEKQSDDFGTHTVCAKMDKDFLKFTASRGNDLSSVVKPNDNWCLCENRWQEAHDHNKAPSVILKASNKNISKKIKRNILKESKKKNFLYNPNNPKKSFDVYINKNPSDTISIKYTALEDVKKTITKLETLYKKGKYPHKRIWQVGMILKVRLEAMLKHKQNKYPNAINVRGRYILAAKYFKFLGKRTQFPETERKKLVFNPI